MVIKEMAEDACTHGLYVSEVEKKYQAYYIGYLITKGRQDLIDTEDYNPEKVSAAIAEIEL
jgi:hypothetical protein